MSEEKNMKRKLMFTKMDFVVGGGGVVVAVVTTLLVCVQASRKWSRFSKWALYHNEIFKSVHIFCCTMYIIYGNSSKLNTNTIHLIQNVAKCVGNWMGKAFTQQDIDTGKLTPILACLFHKPMEILHHITHIHRAPFLCSYEKVKQNTIDNVFWISCVTMNMFVWHNEWKEVDVCQYICNE